jgi:hypothetical protein
VSTALAHRSNKDNKLVDNKVSTSHSKPFYDRSNTLVRGSKNSIDYSQGSIGNQAPPNLVRSISAFDFTKIGILQPKLKVSKPGDVYEQEADRVAEQVMQMSDLSRLALPMTTSKGKQEQKEEEEYTPISRKTSATSKLDPSYQIVKDFNNFHISSGDPLNTSIKERMESGFGYDLSKVRIHTDEKAAKSSDSVHALAYTVGNDIVFGEGQYQQNTLQGRRLLAHELTHVIQQRTQKSGAIESLQRTPNGGKKKPEDEKKLRYHKEVARSAAIREELLTQDMLAASEGATLISKNDIGTKAYLDIPGGEKAADILVRRANGDFDVGDAKGTDPVKVQKQFENTYRYIQKKHPGVRVRFWVRVKETANLNDLGSGLKAPNGILLDANNKPIRIAGNVVTVTGGQKVPLATTTPSGGKAAVSRDAPKKGVATSEPTPEAPVARPASEPTPEAPVARPPVKIPSWMARGARISGVGFTTLTVIGALALSIEFSDAMKFRDALKSGIYFEKFWYEIKKYPNGTRILTRQEPVSGALEKPVLTSVPVPGTIVHNEKFDGIRWDDGVLYQSTFDSHDGFGLIITFTGERKQLLLNKKTFKRGITIIDIV